MDLDTYAQRNWPEPNEEDTKRRRRQLATRKIIIRLGIERVARKMSQDEVAAVLGVARTTISKWESGEVMPSLGATVEWAAVFDMELAPKRKGRH